MKRRLMIPAIFCAVLLGASLAVAGVPEEKAAEPTEYSMIRVPVSTEQVWTLRSGDGEEIYGEFCAECHGASGTGNPIAVAALGEPIPSLVGLESTRKPGEFARAYVQHVLDSRCESRYHKSKSGSLTMPCWRRILSHALESDSRAAVVTASLVNHVESLQQ